MRRDISVPTRTELEVIHSNNLICRITGILLFTAINLRWEKLEIGHCFRISFVYFVPGVG